MSIEEKSNHNKIDIAQQEPASMKAIEEEEEVLNQDQHLEDEFSEWNDLIFSKNNIPENDLENFEEVDTMNDSMINNESAFGNNIFTRYHLPSKSKTVKNSYPFFHDALQRQLNQRKTTKKFLTQNNNIFPQKNSLPTNERFSWNNESDNNVIILPNGFMPIRTFNFKVNTTKKWSGKQNMFHLPLTSNSSNMYYNSITNTNGQNVFNMQHVLQLLIHKQILDEEIYEISKGNFANWIKNQQASRLIQFYFDKTPYQIIHSIFEELKSGLGNYLLDPYGNYFCLKMYYLLSSADKLAFLNQISPILSKLSVNKISTYPIQCIVENSTSLELQKTIFKCLNSNTIFMELAINVYGTHVLEKMLSIFDYTLTTSLRNFIIENFFFLANNNNGLCVIKKIIIVEYKRDNYPKLKMIIINNAISLIQNPFGNYALQIALDNWDPNELQGLYMAFYGKLCPLSLQKYSSNVIEKCMKICIDFWYKFIEEMISNPHSINLLLNNNFGTYVLQTAVKILMENESALLQNNQYNTYKTILLNAIKNNLTMISNSKIIKKWFDLIN